MKKDWMIPESQLDDDQIRVLQATLDKSCIVSGCAGSGKSVLALIMAKRIQTERSNDYQIIVFTKALSRYMNAGRKALGLAKTFTYHHDWVNKRKKPASTYVIVDEIQDFTKEEICDFIKATKGYFYFFGDTAQSIYDGLKTTLPVDDIRFEISAAKNAKVFPLYRNHRLPKPVARVVQVVGVGLDPYDEGVYKSSETAIPRFIKYDDEDEQISAIHRVIRDRELEDVAILLPRNEDVKRVYDKLTQLGGNYEVKYSDRMDFRNGHEDLDFTTSNPKVMTYHSAKGLQFEAVFLPLVEKYPSADSESDRKALYVAMTRTYRYLYVMYSGSLPNRLQTVDAQLYVTTEKDEVEDI